MDLKHLRSIQAISTIVASVAVPVIVAYFGWLIQTNVSTASVRKDYVQMAIGILAQKPDRENDELRLWAVSLLNANSDVPFNKQARAELAVRQIIVRSPIPDSLFDGPLMKPPEPWKLLPQSGPLTNGDLFKNYQENKLMAEQNIITLHYLQQFIRSLATPSSKPPDASSAEAPTSGSVK